MSNNPRLVLLVVLVFACGRQSESSNPAADSTATPMDSGVVTAPADSLAAPRDSARRRDTATAPDAAKTAAKPGPEMGRDSAFGPKYMVDSTGKLIPFPVKRP